MSPGGIGRRVHISTQPHGRFHLDPFGPPRRVALAAMLVDSRVPYASAVVSRGISP